MTNNASDAWMQLRKALHHYPVEHNDSLWRQRGHLEEYFGPNVYATRYMSFGRHRQMLAPRALTVSNCA